MRMKHLGRAQQGRNLGTSETVAYRRKKLFTKDVEEVSRLSQVRQGGIKAGLGMGRERAWRMGVGMGRGRIGGMARKVDGAAGWSNQRLQLADTFSGVFADLVVVCVLAMLVVLVSFKLGDLLSREDLVESGFWVLVVCDAQAEVQGAGVE